MPGNTDTKATSVPVFMGSWLPILIISLWGMMSLVAVFTDTGKELYPPRSLESWSYVVGIGLGALCLAHGFRQRPLSLSW
ncbi:hypothetical protein [Sphingomonas bacterium]|uniref:hypothetical protein n=1 Tax=Sphingomonas bacterium TaxID=1895847 RepID=UPI001C2D1A62|nr:hypothetical protein [Sphingomonas bacterium]